VGFLLSDNGLFVKELRPSGAGSDWSAPVRALSPAASSRQADARPLIEPATLDTE